MPLWGTIGWELFDSSGYDPCASLSWETLMIEGGSSSSPFHIMLFNHGEYLGTATAKPYGFAPTIERVSDSEIAVTYHWPREGEGNANRSGTTQAGFRWDEGQQKVIMSGDVPPTA
ncbi:LppP/LprE family lipoprotein [uncultured Corynebacterium sp.]|uniref:LppP/LprE family lipoprotein n=1 Tax=uncultured Corynebacterium sp. TaxID=159447 RepID=UPI0034326F27